MKLFLGYSRSKIVTVIFLLNMVFIYGVRTQITITSPEDFFGFQMGSDRKLARWDNIVEYFYQLEQNTRDRACLIYITNIVDMTTTGTEIF